MIGVRAQILNRWSRQKPLLKPNNWQLHCRYSRATKESDTTICRTFHKKNQQSAQHSIQLNDSLRKHGRRRRSPLQRIRHCHAARRNLAPTLAPKCTGASLNEKRSCAWLGGGECGQEVLGLYGLMCLACHDEAGAASTSEGCGLHLRVRDMLFFSPS